jgi:hypothetical protein
VWTGGVEQDPGFALLPQLHRLRPVPAGLREPQSRQRAGHLLGGIFVHRELGEGVPGERWGRGEIADPHPFTDLGRSRVAERFPEGEQGSHRVDRCRSGIAGRRR